MKMNTKIYLFILGICPLYTFLSCNKNNIPPIPKLTPISYFSMYFDDFDSEKSVNLSLQNWRYSSVTVNIFNSIALTNLAIPASAFKESFYHTPTYIGDNTWQWTYEFQIADAKYIAKLNGITGTKHNVSWEMFIDKTRVNSIAPFLWFEGITTDSTSANWIIYHNPLSPSPVLNIEWISTATHNVSSLKYTNVDSGSENLNSYIFYDVTNEVVFDRQYAIYLSKDNANISIDWNSTSKKGRVKSLYYFKDESWHCWDENRSDAWCD